MIKKICFLSSRYLLLLLSALFISFKIPKIHSINILPVGDDITKGSKGDGSYRVKLYQNLLSLKLYDKITYIGTRKDWLLAPPNGMTTYHDGYNNQTIQSTVTLISNMNHKYNTTPDIVLLHVGSYDFIVDIDISNAIHRYNDLLLTITNIYSTSHVIATTLLPQRDEQLETKIQISFNNLLQDVVDNHAHNGRKLSFLDMHKLVSRDDMRAVGILPLESGYIKMADGWTNAIVAASSIPFPTVITSHAPSIQNSPTISISPESMTTSKPFPTKIPLMSTNTPTNIAKNITYVTSSPSFSTNTTIMTSSQTTIFSWRFLTISDWHMAEKYVFRDLKSKSFLTSRQDDINKIKFLKKNYGGEFILMPGDTNAGFWDKPSFHQKFHKYLLPPNTTYSSYEIVLATGNRCYQGMISSFHEGGYDNIHIAYGDHEAGDNPWKAYTLKSKLQPFFRKSFARNFNFFSSNSTFKYTRPIGQAASRPINTNYEYTSYATRHKNLLLITLDVFYQKSFKIEIGQAGTVSGIIEGKHLSWFEHVLSQAREDSSIQYIFVQGHLPILFPVRKIRSSGMMMADGKQSDLWKVMKEYNVDIYFCGEVHDHTVTKDSDSNLIQLASRGNYFTSFLTVDIFSNKQIDINSYKMIGRERYPKNFNYKKSGNISIRSNNHDLNKGKTIESSGDLKLLNPEEPILNFNFEEKVLLKERPVYRLKSQNASPVDDKVTIRGVTCKHSLPNMGQFGQQYDAQCANLSLVKYGGIGINDGYDGKYGLFQNNTRASVSAMGPFSGDYAVSLALWFQTSSAENMILFSYEGCWKKTNVFILKVRNGTIELIFRNDQKLMTRQIKEKNNNGQWQHVAIVIPHNGSYLSQIQIYLNGIISNTKLKGIDTVLDLPNSGVIALGGFGIGGYCAKENKEMIRVGYARGVYFDGRMDDVLIWGRSLSASEIKDLIPPKQTGIYFQWKTVLDNWCIGLSGMNQGDWKRARIWPCSGSPSQLWILDEKGKMKNKFAPKFCLAVRRDDEKSVTLKDCSHINDDNLLIQWKFKGDFKKSYVFLDNISEKIVSISGGKKKKGAPIILETSYDISKYQYWEQIFV